MRIIHCCTYVCYDIQYNDTQCTEGEQQVKLCRGKYTFFKDEYRAKVKNIFTIALCLFLYIFFKNRLITIRHVKAGFDTFQLKIPL